MTFKAGDKVRFKDLDKHTAYGVGTIICKYGNTGLYRLITKIGITAEHKDYLQLVEPELVVLLTEEEKKIMRELNPGDSF